MFPDSMIREAVDHGENDGKEEPKDRADFGRVRMPRTTTPAATEVDADHPENNGECQPHRIGCASEPWKLTVPQPRPKTKPNNAHTHGDWACFRKFGRLFSDNQRMRIGRGDSFNSSETFSANVG